MGRLHCGALSAALRHSPGPLGRGPSACPACPPRLALPQDVGRLVLSLCSMLLLLAGCRGAVGPGPLPPSERLATATPIWQQLTARRHGLHTLKGLAAVRLLSPNQNVSLENVVVVLQGLASIRLEGIGALGQPVFLLVADQGRFAFYAPQEARLLSGTASARNLERTFGIALAPDALQAILIGDLPWATLPEGGPVAYRSRDNTYFWEGKVPRQEGTYRLWFDVTHLQPVRFEVEDLLGRVVLRVRYDDVQQRDGFWLPLRITVEQPLVSQQVIWHYSDVQLNVQVAPALFQLRVPAGTERVELE